MIKFEQVGPKKFNIYENDEVLVSIDLLTSTIANKFSIISTYIENIIKKFPEFETWFFNLIKEYETTKEHYKLIEKNMPMLKKFSDDYIDSENIDFNQFVDEQKAKKNTILFNARDIEHIIRLSGYLKIYTIFSNSENYKLDQRLHKKIYNELSSNIDTDLVYKLFSLIKTKTFKYNLTDRYMWDYIKMIQCKSIDVHVIQIFNFIMNSILVLCKQDKNPITYFVTVVDESIKWFLRSVYKASVIYDDSIATEDIQSTNKDNLRTYAYNDTLGRLKGNAYKQIHEELEKAPLVFFEPEKEQEETDAYILNFQKRIENIKHISPICDFFVYPILAAITGIPYSHFRALAPEHAIVLSVYVQGLMKKVFDQEYKTICSMLNYYPNSTPSLITTYKLKNIHTFINTADEINNFFGFKTKIMLCDLLSSFVGKMSRSGFINVFNGKELSGVPVSKLEIELIQFFTLFFAGKMEDKINAMRKHCFIEF